MSLKRPRARRGYMLIEAVVGGAILSTVIISVHQQLGFMDRQISEAGRRTLAQSVLRDGIASMRGRRLATLPSSPVLDHPAGVTERVITVSDPSGTECVGCKVITVSVTYHSATPGRTRTLTATTWVAP
ncbi:MAG: hypothetical protein AB2A00_06485 [Myxococcota bacterium]